MSENLSLGSKIRMLREKLQLSQEQAAELVSIHPNTYARWERDEIAPRGTSLVKLAKALNTTMAYLTGVPDSAAAVPKLESSSNTNEIALSMLQVKFNNGNTIYIPATPEGYTFARSLMLDDRPSVKHFASDRLPVTPDPALVGSPS